MSSRHMLSTRVITSEPASGRPQPQSAMASAHRERGLWSFLTWSFFISQVLAAGNFVGSSAHAASETDAAPAPTDHASVQAAAVSPPVNAAVHASGSDEAATAAKASSVLAGVQHAVEDHGNSSKPLTGPPEHVGNHGAGSEANAQVPDVGVAGTVEA